MFDVWQAMDQLSRYKVTEAGGDNFNEGRYLRSLHPLSSLADLTVPLLQNIEKQLNADLQIVREVCVLCTMSLEATLPSLCHVNQYVLLLLLLLLCCRFVGCIFGFQLIRLVKNCIILNRQ